MIDNVDAEGEHDVLQTLHIYVPTPGDPAVAGPTSVEPAVAKGSVLNLGTAMSGMYTGAGIHTHGHVFIDARGTPATLAEPVPDRQFQWLSRMTFQSAGQAVMQSLFQPLYLLSGDTAVVAANNDAFMTSNRSVSLLAGWAGTVASVHDGESSRDLGSGDDAHAVPPNPLMPSYVDALNSQDRWCKLASSLSSTVSLFMSSVGQRADLSDNQTADPGTGSLAIRTILTPLTAAAGTYGAISSLLSARDPLAIHPGPHDDAVTPAPTLSRGQNPTLGAVNLSALGGISGYSPMGVSFLAGTSASVTAAISASVSALGATSIFGGVSAELTSLGLATVSAVSKVRLTSGHDVQIQARKGDLGIRGRRMQIGYARSADEWETPPADGAVTKVEEIVGAVNAAEMLAGTIAAADALGASGDAPVAATASLFVASATLAMTENAMARRERAEARSRVHPGSAPASLRRLDAHTPDLARPAGKDKQHVLPTSDESIMQQETEDLFLKAKKHIRLKSNEDVRIAAANSCTLRVGEMVVRIKHDSDSDWISIGISSSDDSDSAQLSVPRMSLKKTSSSVMMELESANGTRVVLNGDSSVTMASGSSHVIVNKDGAVDVQASSFKANRNLEVSS